MYLILKSNRNCENMGRLDPELEGCISEGINNFLLDVYDKNFCGLKQYSIKNRDLVKSIEESFNHYKQGEETENQFKQNFSEEFLNDVKKRIVVRILDIMYEEIKLPENIRGLLINYAMELLVLRCYYFEDAEIDNELFQDKIALGY